MDRVKVKDARFKEGSNKERHFALSAPEQYRLFTEVDQVCTER
jgi:hypothetical protein